ncbi:MAG: LLM class flavin-dependent oxidoreductase, partial [Betaproteobacteria bacterium]|nr:LLM class flavin-dependent oxidoreductase [Betaproteobacteria bacterium]
YRFARLQMSPGLASPPPIIMGGAGEQALRRAARVGDGWYGPPCDLAAARDCRDQLHRALEAERRDPAGFQVWVRAPSVGDEAGIRRALDDYRAAGFEHLVVQVPLDLPDAAARVAWVERLARWCGLQ